MTAAADNSERFTVGDLLSRYPTLNRARFAYITSRYRIEPIGRAGAAHLYGPDAVAQIVRALNDLDNKPTKRNCNV